MVLVDIRNANRATLFLVSKDSKTPCKSLKKLSSGALWNGKLLLRAGPEKSLYYLGEYAHERCVTLVSNEYSSLHEEVSYVSLVWLSLSDVYAL